ncbi:MAG: hypothetical protein E4G91_08445 [Candidatus Zixiibacteriota bacterium]|nr:MAG: hypothetical protein E4G91_08445 [candidate division Zixibacteria bacterium]
MTQFYPENPPIFYTVPFSYSDPSDVMADLKEAGWEDVEHDTMQITKIVADPGAFAHATVYGNPLIDEIRQRGGVDPDDVANAVHKEFLARFGPLPASMPLQATAFVCRAP